MPYTISRTNLVNDCYLIFGSGIFNFVDFLNNLSPTELKSAYRKKAFETHPDRAITLGKSRDIMDEHFKNVITAYERLDSIIQGGKRYIIRDEVPKKKRARKASRRTQTKQKSAAGSSYKHNINKTKPEQKVQNIVSDFFYSGSIPKRELLIGQFLYYSGLISWKTLNHAIIWQRRQRPIIGKIAQDWGILSSDEIQRILSERSYKDHFGEYALRNGFISYFEFLAIIGKQKKLQPLIGKYFTQQGILGNYDIKRMNESLKNHNIKVINSNRGVSYSKY